MEIADFAASAVVVSFAIAMAAVVPALLRFAILPAVVLEILFGVLIGPQGMGLVHQNQFLDVLSELGLAILFLIAGLEINPREVRGAPTRLALRGWAFSLVIALALGLDGQALGLFSGAGFIAIAIAIATTAIGALMPILKDAGLLEPPYGPFVLASGAVGKALPLVALSLVLAGAAGLGAQSVILVVFAATSLLAIGLAGRIRHLPLPPSSAPRGAVRASFRYASPSFLRSASRSSARASGSISSWAPSWPARSCGRCCPRTFTTT